MYAGYLNARRRELNIGIQLPTTNKNTAKDIDLLKILVSTLSVHLVSTIKTQGH